MFVRRRWMSPETVTQLKFSAATDCWSYGVVMWEIWTNAGDVPFAELDDLAVMKLLKTHTGAEAVLVAAGCPPSM